METALEFWKKADIIKLGNKWNYKEKLPYEIYSLIPHLMGSGGIWDAAKGDGRILDALSGIFKKIPMWGTDLATWDLNEGIPGNLPEWVDTVLLMGVVQFLEDFKLHELFQKLNKHKIIVRSACHPESVYINRFSDELQTKYESYYRSLLNLTDMIKETHTVTYQDRVYPPHLESKYGTTQYLLVGVPCV
jgi:hypothetical protein